MGPEVSGDGTPGGRRAPFLVPLQLCLDFLFDGARPPRPPQLQPPPRVTPPVSGVSDAEAPAPRPRFELLRSPQRRTLSLEVHPDLRVIVRAPQRARAIDIEFFVAERAAWIDQQVAWFRSRPVANWGGLDDGDVQRHLGRDYVLRLRPREDDGVVLTGTELVVGGRHARSAEHVRAALTSFWRAEARREFTRLLEQWHRHPRFARYPRPALTIRAMRSRWGSLGSRRGMTLNLALVHAPAECIEYVVVHELCHLRYHGHGRGFYALLEAVLPDWRARKERLDDSVR